MQGRSLKRISFKVSWPTLHKIDHCMWNMLCLKLESHVFKTRKEIKGVTQLHNFECTNISNFYDK